MRSPTILSSRADALRNPSAHIFKPGRGYIRLGALTKTGAYPIGKCNPPATVADSTYHELQPPGGHPPIVFEWKLRARSWVRYDPRAKRLGFVPDYLSSYGWVYSKPVSGVHG